MKKSEIKNIKTKEILDSRGIPTIEVELITEIGSFFASVPSGTSTGQNEAKELPALKAVENVEKIILPELKGKKVVGQKEIDDLMIKLDGTKDKSQLGANAVLAVSIAVCRAGAVAKDIPLYNYLKQIQNSEFKMPSPCLLMVEGGVHTNNELDFQEFMIMPKKNSFSENFKIGTEIYQTLKIILEKEKLSTGLGMEGGFNPLLKFPEEVLDLITRAIDKAGYKDEIGIILDCTASQFFKNNRYHTNMGVFNRDELLKYYLDLISKYPIIGLEDPFSEEDWQSWKELNFKIKNYPDMSGLKILLIGDDLLATNIERVKKAVTENACNGMIVKPNQIGTVSETLEVVKYAQKNSFKIFVKHRSGETKDDFIADLAVAVGADGIMAGAPSRPERLAKYNRLFKIEEWLN